MEYCLDAFRAQLVGREMRIVTAIGLSAAIVATAAPPVSPVVAAPQAAFAPHVPGVVIVAYRAGVSPVVRADIRSMAGANHAVEVSSLASAVDRLELAPGVSVEEAIRGLSGQRGVRYAEPDYLIEPTYVANDPKYVAGQQWGVGGDGTSPSSHYGSAAAEAWAAGFIGSSDVYVGIVDEGVQNDHPDLRSNVWTNPFDPVDGRDNDGNGYVDDIHGWDFFNNDKSVFDGTASDGTDDHGTHVAGIIGAQGGNGIGVAGVNWAVTMISTKFLGPQGGSTSGAIRALDYLTDLKIRHGLNIVATNNSWGYRRGYGQALVEAINRSGDAGALFVAAAGNEGANNDSVPFNPASFECATRQDTGAPRGYDCIMSAASIASNGALSSFSNRGAETVDLGAPGQSVMSTFARDSYGLLSGTSMATPHVTGAIALCASMNPSLDAAELRAAILRSTAPTASLDGRTVTGGRLDIGAMIAHCLPSISGSPSQLAASLAGPRLTRLDWVDGVLNEAAYEIQRANRVAEACDGWQLFDRIGANSSSYYAETDGGRGYCFRVRAIAAAPGSTRSAWTNEAQIQLPDSVPGPPPSVKANPANAAALVSWAAPAGDGGRPIVGYTVSSSPQGHQCFSTGELSCTVSNLTNGLTYRFTVKASNELGTGPPSDASAPVTPGTVPGPPTSVDAQGRDSASIVSWAAPNADGGRSITGYTALSFPDGRSCATNGALSCSMSGLSNGTAYTFTVRATNAIGTGPQSEPSAPVTPSTDEHDGVVMPPPSIALVSSATLARKVQVELTWTPGQTSDSAVDNYELQRKSGQGEWRDVAVAPGDESARVALERTKAHTFRIRAVDATGFAGPWATTEAMSIGVLQETDASIAYTGRFKRAWVDGASKGYVRQAAVGERFATLSFSGSSVAWVTTLAPTRGIAEIRLDGVNLATVDLYASRGMNRQIAWAASFAAGAHVLEIYVTGIRNPASSGTRVDVDAFAVLR